MTAISPPISPRCATAPMPRRARPLLTALALLLWSAAAAVLPGVASAEDPAWWPDPNCLGLQVPEAWVQPDHVPVASAAQMATMFAPGSEASRFEKVHFAYMPIAANQGRDASNHPLPPFYICEIDITWTGDRTVDGEVGTLVANIQSRYGLDREPTCLQGDHGNQWQWRTDAFNVNFHQLTNAQTIKHAETIYTLAVDLSHRPATRRAAR